MNAALIRARDAMTARGFTEHEAVALLLPIIGDAFREFAAAFTKSADDLDPPTVEEGS